MNWKTTFKLKVILSISFFTFLSFSLTAQERTCGMVEHMQEKMKDPDYAKQYNKSQAKFKAQLEKNLANKHASKMMDPIIIPVAVHFTTGIESDRACLEALAQNQIDILNQDYTATNPDFSQWSSASTNYPGVNAGAANILFCIATMNHPTGTDPDLVEGGPAVTIGYNFGNGNDTDANWGGYMNFVIKNAGDGILGYSPLGGSIANGDSVVMNLGAFGSGSGCPSSGIVPSAPYNLGRTVTHELGHFYNLDHTFSGDCSSDDNIADTPNIDQPTYGCPTVGGVQMCGNTSLTMNYMDYVDDLCMYMFSAGQITVVEAFIMSLESQFKPNVIACSITPNFTIVSINNSESICTPTNNVVYNLTYTATGGNTDSTTFSATGLPNGATATFNPTSLNDNGNFTLTVDNLNAASAGNYAITVTGTGVATNSTVVDLVIQGAIPSTPTLTSPANGTTNAPLSINLNWNASAEASNYTVETATNSGFTANATSNVVNTATFTTPLLSETTQYFWRVKSTNSCGESVYSSVYNFTTAAATCSTLNSTQNNIAIPATGNDFHVITSTINIGSSMIVADVNVTVNIQHIWAGDMELKLVSPNGTEVLLLANSKCDDGTDDIGVTYDDQASGPVVCSTTAPCVGGVIQPEEALSPFNGENAQGDWILVATDGYPSADGGMFQNFSIEICGTSALSVDEFDIENSIKLWPNPSNGDINLSLNTQNNDNIDVSLYDLRGRLINKQSFSNSGMFSKKLNYQNIENAVYILRIENSGQIINKRIIINK